MGKSPAKWIKTVLFGKKSSRSNSTKKGISEKKTTGEKAPLINESSPVISEPVLVTTISSGAKEEIHISESSPVVNQEVTTQIVTELDCSENQEKLLEEKAAVKAQSAFRGYLARRAFKALKGIIRLQALIRGHLVRRQAIANLRAIYFIVRFQALVRGSSVRKSCTGFGTNMRNLGTKKYSDAWKEYSYANAFIGKLLSYNTKVEPLHFEYQNQDPNSSISWLTRFTLSKTWKPIPKPKKPAFDSLTKSSQSRRSSYAMETESAKLKRKNHKTGAVNSETGQQTGQTGRVSSSRKLTCEESSNGPLTELEKVKRNLRKVTSLVPDNNNEGEVSSERNSVSVREIVVPVPNSGTGTIVVPEVKPKREKDTVVEAEIKREKDVLLTESNEEQNGNSTEVESSVEETIVEGQNGKLSKEEVELPSNEISNNNKTASKRRSSLSTPPPPPSAKTEYSDNKEIIPNNNNNNDVAPAVPSYMQMTKSAKTKLKGTNSPRLSADNGSNGSTRRHSLPNSGGKLNSHSPRTQRPVQVKAGIKTDKSADKLEWRR